jgi:4-hydroxy-tetrahydrodipicolinate synthase
MIRGTYTALVTPFREDGSINYKKVEELIEFQIKNKIDGIVVCGTTGEAATLSDLEKKSLIRFVVEKVNKRIPVMAGTGSNDTMHSIELSKYAENVGADSLLLVTPYYNKTNQQGLIEHFTTIANNVTIPCVLYNVPSRTSMDILPDTVITLSKVDNIVGIKEASNNFSNILKLMANKPKDFCVMSGNDDSIVPLLSLGGDGVISVLSNIYPLETHNICENFFKQNYLKATTLQIKFADIIEKLFCDVNPIPIKQAMNMLGFNVGDVRLPLIQLEDNKSKILKESLEKIDIN